MDSITQSQAKEVLAKRLETVEKRIEAACRRAGRSRSEVTLVAITKTVSAEIAAILPSLGVLDLGESRLDVRRAGLDCAGLLGVLLDYGVVLHTNRQRALASRLKLRQMLSRSYQPVPIGGDIFRRAADLRDSLGGQLRRHHFNCIPRTDGQLVGVRLLLRNMDTNFTADAPLDVDLAPGLVPFQGVVHRDHRDAIDRADFKARLAACAIVGIDDRHLFGQLLSGTRFRHIKSPCRTSVYTFIVGRPSAHE